MDKNDIPAKLIGVMDDKTLGELYSRLKRTRRRFYLFSLNGSVVIATRRSAIDSVEFELASRGVKFVARRTRSNKRRT